MAAQAEAEKEGTIRVLLHAQLRYYNEGLEEKRLPFRKGANIREYVETLSIPGHEFMGVALDGELSGDMSRIPRPGSTLELIPAMSGG